MKISYGAHVRRRLPNVQLFVVVTQRQPGEVARGHLQLWRVMSDAKKRESTFLISETSWGIGDPDSAPVRLTLRSRLSLTEPGAYLLTDTDNDVTTAFWVDPPMRWWPHVTAKRSQR